MHLYVHYNNKRKQPKCLLKDEWIKKMCFFIFVHIYIYISHMCTHTHTHTHTHSGLLLGHKKSEILSMAAPRIDLEGISLCEICQID